MRHRTVTVLSLGLAACPGPETDTDGSSDSAVVINEFVASNATGHTDETGAFPDWIELWNSADAAADLTGWTLTDDLTEPDKWAFDDAMIIDAGGFLVLFADGDTAGGSLHTSFRLDAEIGEDIGLFDADGDAVDQITYQAQVQDQSQARMPDGSDDWEEDTSPTPGASND